MKIKEKIINFFDTKAKQRFLIIVSNQDLLFERMLLLNNDITKIKQKLHPECGKSSWLSEQEAEATNDFNTMKIIERLEEIEKKYDELNSLIHELSKDM